jgi:ribonuclease-3
LDKTRLKNLREFSKLLKIPLKNAAIFNNALTHKSYAYELGTPSLNNERLEFLGDAVLGLVISEHLFFTYPSLKEGEMSKIKSIIVSASILGEKAKEIHLNEFILLGKGEEKSGGRVRSVLLADTLEAVIGATYLIGGFKLAQKLILTLFGSEISKAANGEIKKDYKTQLQEFIQKSYGEVPKYQIEEATGPDHNRTFRISCQIRGQKISSGVGKSKKDAEQQAAQMAYLKITSKSME